MNYLLSIRSLLVVAVVFLFSNCTKDDNGSAVIDPDTTVVTGNWSISNFRQRTEDKTSQYVGYTFSFASNGDVTATKGSSTTDGTWSYAAVSGSNYIGIFSISLGDDDPLKRLNESWLVDAGQTNPNQLKLTHPEAAEDEHVTFSK